MCRVEHPRKVDVIALPALLDDDRSEVDVDLVASFDEVVDSQDAVLDARSAYVHELRRLRRHEREPHSRAAPRVVAEEVPVNVLGREGGLRVRQPPEEVDEIPNVVA